MEGIFMTGSRVILTGCDIYHDKKVPHNVKRQPNQTYIWYFDTLHWLLICAQLRGAGMVANFGKCHVLSPIRCCASRLNKLRLLKAGSIVSVVIYSAHLAEKDMAKNDRLARVYRVIYCCWYIHKRFFLKNTWS